MKKKLRTILKDTIIYRSKDLFYFSVILFLCTSILSMSLFFTGGNAIEKSLANALDLTLSFKNTGYFASDYEGTLFINYPELNQNLSKMFIDDLEELSSEDDLAYANYSLAIDCYYQLQDKIPQSTALYGLRDTSYLTRNNISLEGCTKEDLIADTVILPFTDKERGIQINDPYFISDPKDSSKIIKELKVIGFYKDTRWTSMNSDPISSHSPPITTNDTILTLLDSYPFFYGYYSQGNDYIYLNKLQICNMEFTAKNINGYSRFIKRFNSFSMEENSKFARTCSEGNAFDTLGLQTNVNTFGSILKSIERIKLIYNFIFISIWILLLLSLFSFLSFLQKKNAYDISVRRLLGETKKKTVFFYIRYYLFPSIPSLILGEPCGYMFASILSKFLYRNSLSIQNEMTKITGSTIHLDTNSMFSNISISRVFLISIVISLLMISIICIATGITTLAQENCNPRKQARGEQYE